MLLNTEKSGEQDQEHSGKCLLNTGPDYLVNPFPNKHWFLRVCSARLLKTPWEK